MGKSIAVAAIVVFACFVLGFVHGQSDASQPEPLLHEAVRHSHFSMNDKRQVALVYSCDSDIYVWDISTKEYAITPLEAKRRIESGLGQPRVPITSQRTTAISASLGGVVGAWTLKDAVAAIEAGKGKKRSSQQ
jgi:hypothetical protein